jgi:NAD(P)-dependent dehydrogenase (short-subunit alcohol dehydrogenase family)
MSHTGGWTLTMNIRSKVCLISGGSSGIGAATAHVLARLGANVAVVGRTMRREALESLQALTDAERSKSVFVRADVGNMDDCVRCVDEVCDKLGPVDVLVHAAGTAVPGNMFEVTDGQWRNAFDVHLHSAFWLARAVAPHMIQQKEGAIVLIGSAAGLRGCPTSIAYAVAKGALPQLTRALARELAVNNVRVNCVSPGVIRTPFQDMLTPEQVQINIGNRIPLRREGQPEDVADAIVGLIRNEFITGENLSIDGGMTMRMV